MSVVELEGLILKWIRVEHVMKRRETTKSTSTPATPSYPLRLNRYLALRALTTRRGADVLIAAGKVRINGRVAVMGDKVTSEADRVEVDRDALPSARAHRYVAYHKPRGIITHSPQRGERSIADVCGVAGVFPVGRLDKDSEGLIILTDDGRVTDRLLAPGRGHEKEYVVTVAEQIPADVPDRLRAGVVDDGQRLRAADATITEPRTLTVILTEGKKHQVRRLCRGVGLTVRRLVRTRIMDVHLGSLPVGDSRHLRGMALRAFLADLGLSDDAV